MIDSAKKREEAFRRIENSGSSTLVGFIGDSGIISLNELWNEAVDGYGADWIRVIKSILAKAGVSWEPYSYNLYDCIGKDLNLDQNQLFLDLTSAWIEAANELNENAGRLDYYISALELEESINAILLRERFDKKLVKGEFVPFDKTLSYQGIETSLSISLNNQKYQDARESLIQALKSYNKGYIKDSLTHGGRSLEQFLSAEGFSEKVPSQSVNKAVANGFISNNDRGLWDWLLSSRNKFSNSHNGQNPDQKQVWSYLEILASVFERYSS